MSHKSLVNPDDFTHCQYNLFLVALSFTMAEMCTTQIRLATFAVSTASFGTTTLDQFPICL